VPVLVRSGPRRSAGSCGSRHCPRARIGSTSFAPGFPQLGEDRPDRLGILTGWLHLNHALKGGDSPLHFPKANLCIPERVPARPGARVGVHRPPSQRPGVGTATAARRHPPIRSEPSHQDSIAECSSSIFSQSKRYRRSRSKNARSPPSKISQTAARMLGFSNEPVS